MTRKCQNTLAELGEVLLCQKPTSSGAAGASPRLPWRSSELRQELQEKGWLPDCRTARPTTKAIKARCGRIASAAV